MKPVREPAVAGQFYPSDPALLAGMVDDLLAAAAGRRTEIAPRLVALVAPHAGYAYSGRVAAGAYSLLSRGSFGRVVVLAPSHRIPLRGSSIYARGAYRTPLGLVPVDEEFAERILSCGGGELVFEPEIHRREHSLEVQLPFLQRALGAFQLVPIVMGRQDEPHLTRLAEAIAKATAATGGAERTLLVASTDLSHYFADEAARALDGVILGHLSRFDADGLYGDLAAGRCEACGGGPMVATLRAARLLGASACEVIDYATSGDATGDRAEVVGYVAAALRGGAAGDDSD